MCFTPQIKDRIYIYQLWNLKNSKIHWASTCDNENENIYGFAKRLAIWKWNLRLKTIYCESDEDFWWRLLILKVISQLVFIHFILKTLLFQYVSCNLYQSKQHFNCKCLFNCCSNYNDKYLSWMAMLLLLFLLTSRGSSGCKRELNYMNI